MMEGTHDCKTCFHAPRHHQYCNKDDKNKQQQQLEQSSRSSLLSNNHQPQDRPTSSSSSTKRQHSYHGKCAVEGIEGTAKRTTNDFCHIPGNRVSHQTELTSLVNRKMPETWVITATDTGIDGFQEEFAEIFFCPTTYQKHSGAKSTKNHSLTGGTSESESSYEFSHSIIAVVYVHGFDLTKSIR